MNYFRFLFIIVSQSQNVPCDTIKNFCLNNSTCVTTDFEMKHCLCEPGFSGSRCEININDCFIEPGNSKEKSCKNGAKCTDLINGYSCQCLPGFIGDSCEIGKFISLEGYQILFTEKYVTFNHFYTYKFYYYKRVFIDLNNVSKIQLSFFSVIFRMSGLYFFQISFKN